MNQGEDGVIRFSVTRDDTPVDFNSIAAVCRTLIGWRGVFRDLEWVGRNPERYGGVGFGNLSARLSNDEFVITGTGTGGKDEISYRDLSVVLQCDYEQNKITSRGALPSSEALTHASVYEAWGDAQFVIHVHAPRLWRCASELQLPTIPANIEYGTTQMALAVRGLVKQSKKNEAMVCVMAGHEDGLIAAGIDGDAAAKALLVLLARSYGGV